MKLFQYQRASDVPSAIAMVSQDPGAQFMAGGTSQVDLMKEDVQRPRRLVDISRLPLVEIEPMSSGGLRIGANVKNAVAASHPLIRTTYPAISEALLAGASKQIRNMASMVGNLLQRTCCPYLRDANQSCNKRDPGTGCAAVDGYNRMHAIFGQSDQGGTSAYTCIATPPCDLAVALGVELRKIRYSLSRENHPMCNEHEPEASIKLVEVYHVVGDCQGISFGLLRKP